MLLQDAREIDFGPYSIMSESVLGNEFDETEILLNL